MNTTNRISRTQVLSLLLAAVVVFSTTAGLAAAATTTDLTVSITDDNNTVAPGETTTVEVAVADVEGGVGAAEFGVELSDPGVATITDVSVEAGFTDNVIVGGGESVDVRYFGGDTDDVGSDVVIVEVTLQAAAEGSTDVSIVQNSQTGQLFVGDESGAGYTLDNVGSATLTVEDVNQEPVADAGDDQTVQSGDTVTLDGSGSMDPDPEDTLSFSWTETTDSGVTLSDADTATPTFTAPDVSSETTLEFQLEVTDDGASDTDTVSVTVQPPDAANFQVSNLDAPSTATQGDAIDVSADVENTGGQTATRSVEFRVDTNDDGSIADESAVISQDVELDPGESTTVTFEDVDTSGLPVGTLTHGVATPDDSATAQITIEEPAAPPAGETTVSLEPTDQTTAVGAVAAYDIVVDSADGGVGAAELRVAVDDTNIAAITDADALGVSGSEEVEVAGDGSFVDIAYFGANTADTGPVTVATVTVQGTGAGSASLSFGPTDSNSDLLVFDESAAGYTVTGTNGASLEVLPVQFLVDSTSAPEKAAVGNTVTVTATISSDGSVESTQPVELLFDVDGDGTTESVGTEQVTVGANGQTQVSFDVQVPEDASFGDREYSVETIADSSSGTVEFTPPDINGDGALPGDLNGDGLYEDVNGDGEANVGDAQALFSSRNSDAVQDNADAFDFNDDGSVNVGDAQALFSLVTP